MYRHQPWEIRVFHWLFFIVIMLKFWSGFYISFPHPFWGFGGMYSARMMHATMTPVLAALLVFRLYYALLTGDWKSVLFRRRADGKKLLPWLRYMLFLEHTPPPRQEKYNAGQRLLFTAIFLTMPFFYTTGVVMLNFPFFRWLNVFYGGQGISRIVHYLVSVFLAALVAVHIYLALTQSAARLKAMVSGHLPLRPQPMKGTKPDDSSDPSGSAGQPGHVR